jgi:hypothetical protein
MVTVMDILALDLHASLFSYSTGLVPGGPALLLHGPCMVVIVLLAVISLFTGHDYLFKG